MCLVWGVTRSLLRAWRRGWPQNLRTGRDNPVGGRKSPHPRVRLGCGYSDSHRGMGWPLVITPVVSTLAHFS